jgi:hypothetical protein
MNDSKGSLEQARRQFPAPERVMESLRQKRDRKLRTQRIAAGVVGIAVFVAAIWVTTGVASLDRTEQSTTPGGDPGPSETADNGSPFSEDVRFVGLPPVGAALSEPARGDLVASDQGYQWAVLVFADGRLIWHRDAGDWFERRLTPKGVDRLRLRPDLVGEFEQLPAGIWEDAHARQYVAARYGICTSREAILGFPQRAQDLLSDSTSAKAIERGEVEFFAGSNGSTCPAVTVDEARELDRIFLGIGYRRTEESAQSVWYEIHGDNPSLVFTMLLPNDELAQVGGA